MFSMSPTLNNSLQSLYNQYSGPQSGQGFNPNQPLWMQSQGLPMPQMSAPQNPALTGPALASSNAQLPGMQTNPGINPHILAILQSMMSGTPLGTPAPGTTPPGSLPPGSPGTNPRTGRPLDPGSAIIGQNSPSESGAGGGH